jgi:CheY-like chemotaxis protein
MSKGDSYENIDRLVYDLRSELNAPMILLDFLINSKDPETKEYGIAIKRALLNVTYILEEFESHTSNKKPTLGSAPQFPTTEKFLTQSTFVEPILPKNETAPAITTSLSNGHILIVEDNPVSQTLVKKILEKNGYTSEIAASGEDALLIVNRTKFQLVLMDVSLPGIDGFETTRLIKEHENSANVPVLALSAHTNPEVKITASDVGMVGFISKPVNSNQLISTIKSAISNSNR